MRGLRAAEVRLGSEAEAAKEGGVDDREGFYCYLFLHLCARLQGWVPPPVAFARLFGGRALVVAGSCAVLLHDGV